MGGVRSHTHKPTHKPTDSRIIYNRFYMKLLNRFFFTGEKAKSPQNLGQQFVGQELTIDTNSYTSSISTISPSPVSCPSRLSTRSSTLQSLSSPSPSGSSVTAGRRHSRAPCILACPVHAMSSLEDKLTCPECQLLEQSLSPGLLNSRLHSSGQLHSNYSHRSAASSCEPSPVPKSTQSVIDKANTKSSRKRRKSSNLSSYESDSSPPRLEKTTSISPNSFQDGEVFSEPPEITNSPTKASESTAKKLPNRTCISNNQTSNLCSSGNEEVSLPKRILRPTSFKKKSRITSRAKKCNNNHITASKVCSEDRTALSEFDPLPLKYCTRRKLVEEIKAVLGSDR